MKRLALAAAVVLLSSVFAGVAVAQMDSDFSIGGAIRVGASSTTCNSAASGGIRYNSGGAGTIEFCNGSTWANVGSSGGGGGALSGITAATATNVINNANFAQSWGWNSLTTGNALSMGSSSMTTGSLMYLSSTRNNATTTGSVLRLDVSGASSQGVALMISNAGTGLTLRANDDGTITDSTPFVIDAAGQVGVGTASPAAKLDVEGAVQIAYNSESCSAASHVGAIRFNSSTFSICRDHVVGWEPLVGAGAGGVCDSTQTYSSPGTFSYVVPPTFGVITIRLWGGGGGGGGYGGPGGAGGDTSILSRSLLAQGGGGGGVDPSTGNTAGAGGAGGMASGGSINTNGTAGSNGAHSNFGGAGANAPNGGSGGNSQFAINNDGYTGGSPGAGGGGSRVSDIYGYLIEGGGGGSGGYVEKTYTPASLTPGTTINDVVVGDRGARGAAGGWNSGGYGGYGRVSIICTSGGNPNASGGDDQIAFFSGGSLTSTTDFLYQSSSGSLIVGATAGQMRATPVSAQTIAAGDTITANACGTVKRINAAGTVTTAVGAFTAPAAANAGCCMDVINTGASAITLIANPAFKTIGGANQTLSEYDAMRVCSDGANWYQISPIAANQ